ncbi:magnesium/cobalt transporter CorA [Kallotenue papyrolyticum]|uniref:magnesium/cobalt transporter CorA n=1 Tax=Kallotenue papyrolyticum TaxID=1325125 RepID=UPI0004723A61|nr:magnesium/cobalt transporter CorA [Kallotenue papyrolyticum]
MHELIVCRRPGQFLTNVDPAQISELRRQHDTILWLDLLAPSVAELRLLQEEFGFHPLAIEDAARPAQRPKVDSYDHYYFVVFYCLRMDVDRLSITPIYLFIGHNYLVTVHHAPVPQIAETLRRWRAPDSPLGQDIGALIYALLDAIVDEYFPLMDAVADRAENLEERIFDRFDEGVLQAIFQLKKDLLQLRRVIAPERDVLNVMLRRDIPVFDQQDVTYLQDVYDHLLRTLDAVDTYRDLLSSALDSFLSMQSNRLNQVVKALTIASIILMSVTLVAGIYGMNFRYMPELEWRYGYAWALGLMAAIALGLILFFRRIRWL